MLVGESILAGSTLLICAVFVYVWRKSAAVYLAIWGLASTFNAWFPDPRLNIAAVLALLLAARPPASRSEWKVAIPIVAFPFIIPQRFAAVNLVAVYVLAFLVFRDWLPRIVLAALVVQHAAYVAHVSPDYPAFDFILQALLAFFILILSIEKERARVDELRSEVEELAKAAIGSAEIDHLTGLRNRMALDRLLDEPFAGVVAVSDLDHFKEINDRFGHLTGDEVLRSVGHLIRSSIRSEDDAFRWGGDEFVILFRHPRLDLARGRMRVLQERLQTFRIRSHGPHPLGLSWGAAEGDQRNLRSVLEQADLQMYEQKRQARAGNV
jgi:diguanylate cyclase (GGDEF)-like protein